MAPTITISRTTSTRALLTALFAVVVLLVSRTVKNALSALKTARQWLQSQHSFYGEDGDAIKCTGWQFVGYNIIAAAVAILLCIKY
jgi:hypothetical protein